MTTAQEIAARSGGDCSLIARRLSDAELHSEIAFCERLGDAAPAWRKRLYDALLVERYLRPPILEAVDDPSWYELENGVLTAAPDPEL